MAFIFGGKEAAKLEFAYWESRGRGEHIRLLLEYLGIAYNERNFDPSGWRSVKQSQPSKLPASLPYIIDNIGQGQQEQIFDTDAIANYLCQKKKRFDLLGKNTNEVILLKSARGAINDLFEIVFQGLVMNPSYKDELTKTLLDKIHPKLRQISNFLGTKLFLIGDLTYVDFHLYETLREVDAVFEAYKKLPKPQQLNLGGPGAPQQQAALPPPPPPPPALAQSQPIGQPAVGLSQPLGSQPAPGTQAPGAFTFGAPAVAQPVAQLQPSPDPLTAGLDLYPNLKEFLARFDQIPQIAALRARHAAEKRTQKPFWVGTAGLQI